jgi:uncharacterized protein (TIGR03382 family)
MHRTLSLVALITLLGTHSLGQAEPVNLLVNGSFESTSLANGRWTNTSAITGWTRLGGTGGGFEVRNNVVGSAQDGRNFIELDTNGNTSIGQYLDNLTAGAHYDLSFWYSPREGQPATTNGIQVFWNGLLLDDTITGQGGRGNSWSFHQYQLVAAQGRNLLSFTSVGASDGRGGSLDNVSLTNSVPEPGTLTLALAALAGAFLLPRRLRRQAEQRRATALASTLARQP